MKIVSIEGSLCRHAAEPLCCHGVAFFNLRSLPFDGNTHLTQSETFIFWNDSLQLRQLSAEGLCCLLWRIWNKHIACLRLMYLSKSSKVPWRNVQAWFSSVQSFISRCLWGLFLRWTLSNVSSVSYLDSSSTFQSETLSWQYKANGSSKSFLKGRENHFTKISMLLYFTLPVSLLFILFLA